MEETLLELDVKLKDFVDTRIEVGNYWQIVKDKYDALDFVDEKFKRKYPDIALVWRGRKPRS